METTNLNTLVSICIPTYNGAAYLHQCLQSAIGQTYPETEILVVDDRSTDETIAIAERFAAEHKNIRIIRNEVQMGMVMNWNSCIELAEGEWIKFLFQDDLLSPDCVEQMMNACKTHHVHVAVCRRDFIFEKGISPSTEKFFKEEIIKPETIFNDKEYYTAIESLQRLKPYLLTNVIGEPVTFLFRKKDALKYGFFNVHMKQLVDYEFIIGLIVVKGFVFCPAPLATFRIHDQSASSDNKSDNKEDQYKNIIAERGDKIVLLSSYLYDPAFKLVKELLGEKYLSQYIKYLYYSGCKKFGEESFRIAINDIIEEYPKLMDLHYSFTKYALVRSKIKSNKLILD